jgi:hypothetical protein
MEGANYMERVLDLTEGLGLDLTEGLGLDLTEGKLHGNGDETHGAHLKKSREGEEDQAKDQ